MSDEQIDLLDWLAAHPPGCFEVMPFSYEDATEAQGVTPVLLTRADPPCNMHRFYGLERVTSFFCECGVARHWERIGTTSRNQTDWFSEPQEAEAAFQDRLRAKCRRGYALQDASKI